MLQKRQRSASVSSASSLASVSSSASSSSSYLEPSHLAKQSRAQHDGQPVWTCSLAPTCSHRPQEFRSAAELEQHYAKVHELVCEAVVISSGSSATAGGKGKGKERVCGCVFPDRRLLDLHQNEFHNPLLAELEARGERIYACLLPPTLCAHKSKTPKGRRLHMIDAHKYPKEYFFAVVKVGIGQLLLTQGFGASLLRPPHTPTPLTSPPTASPSPSLPAISSLAQRPPADTAAQEDDLDALAGRMAASLAFTPRSVQRKGKMVVK